MYPRTNYEMTQEDLEDLLDRCRATPMMKIGSYHSGASAQENANRAWARLGKKMGFDSNTVQPASGGDRFFTAIPSETEEHRTARITKEKEEARVKEIEKLTSEILERQERVKALSRGDA